MSVQKIIAWLLLLALITLPSCTRTSPDKYDDVPASNEANTVQPPDEVKHATLRSGVRDLICASIGGDYVIWNDMAFSKKCVTNLLTGEVFSLCSNPLCGEKHDDLCAVNIMKDYDCFAVCSDDVSDDMIIYASHRIARVINGQLEETHSFRRYNFSTGVQEILLDNVKLQGTAWRMDPVTKIIYYMAYEVNEDGESELGLYTLNTLTKESRRLSVLEEQLILTCIVENYMYGFASRGIPYRFALDDDSFELEALPYTGYVYNGYLYIEERKGTVRCAVPDEIVPYCEKYNAPAYRDFLSVDLYRLDLTKEDAKPELLIPNIYQCTINSEYFCYTVLEPHYEISYLNDPQYFSKKYELDDPRCPASATVTHEFSPHNGTLHIVQVDTMEPVATISSERYSIVNATCRATSAGIVADFYDYSMESILSGQKHFVAYVPINKPVLTEEDAVRIQLN